MLSVVKRILLRLDLMLRPRRYRRLVECVVCSDDEHGVYHSGIDIDYRATCSGCGHEGPPAKTVHGALRRYRIMCLEKLGR